jgi:hypothetical protein
VTCCATENLVIAGESRGRPGAIAFDDHDGGGVHIELTHGPARAGELYQAIPARQTTPSEYDGRPVPSEDLKRLDAAAGIGGVSIALLTAEEQREAVLEHVINAKSRQADDPAFVKELGYWVRFSYSEALKTADGLFSKCTGNPVLPAWIGRPLFRWLFRKDAENEKYKKQIRSSSGVAVFIGDKEDKDHWIKVGRSFQRFALQATALGIRHAHINQPVEVDTVRSEFANWLGIANARPDLVVRFGYAPVLPMSLRPPVDTVAADPKT